MQLLFIILPFKNKQTKLNQQHDVKFTMIGDSGSLIPNVMLLTYCNTQNIPFF
jgi:hypothetical protein